MAQNTKVNQHIHEFLDYYIKLDKPEYAVLLSGKWGSGKTFFIENFIENRRKKNNVVKISLFGLKTKEDIHKKVIFKLFGLDNHHNVKIIVKSVGFALNKFVGIKLIDMSMEWALKQAGNQNAIFIFDDLERANIELTELHGYINGLTEKHKQKVILLADEDKLNEDEKYLLFKEKTIGKTFQIEQDFKIAFATFLDELKNSKVILQHNQSVIESVYETAGYNNLRSLRQGLLDFDRLINHFESKFKNHVELMTEIIQIFFALTFEIKSGKLDIQTLQEITMLRVGRMMNEEKTDEELTPIEKVFHKYSFLSYELLLSMESWIDLFTLGILPSERIKQDLQRSRYFFREEREEWINLWYFRELEEDEFKNALEDTLKKLQYSEYLTPEIVMHISGILLNLSANGLYSKTKMEILHDMKTYIDTNRKKWDNIYTVDDFNIDDSAFGLGYHQGETDEFHEIKNYLLEKAKETIYEDLPSQGEQLLNILKENDISLFKEMLSKSRDSILYRLPVFQNIDPKMFVESLSCIKNKDFRYVINTLIGRYDQVGWGEYSLLLVELDFWKIVYETINTDIQNMPVNIKMVWFKRLNQSIEEKIVRKMEKQIQHMEKENNVE
ncbi:P-loop NTPase fold protein [Sulfuricurvum sp.]|uniref:P-loop NTPase fold protein n=1 Tax=Sulfuricurvum sp. TaxID=2025608 RepID=UPI003BB0C809